MACPGSFIISDWNCKGYMFSESWVTAGWLCWVCSEGVGSSLSFLFSGKPQISGENTALVCSPATRELRGVRSQPCAYWISLDFCPDFDPSPPEPVCALNIGDTLLQTLWVLLVWNISSSRFFPIHYVLVRSFTVDFWHWKKPCSSPCYSRCELCHSLPKFLLFQAEVS